MGEVSGGRRGRPEGAEPMPSHARLGRQSLADKTSLPQLVRGFGEFSGIWISLLSSARVFGFHFFHRLVFWDFTAFIDSCFERTNCSFLKRCIHLLPPVMDFSGFGSIYQKFSRAHR